MPRLVDLIRGESFLENAFVKWVLSFAATPGIAQHLSAQQPVTVDGHDYRLDFLLTGSVLRVVVELDGFAYHSDRKAFVHDRIRQNHLVGLQYRVLRFSYEMIRGNARQCVAQLQTVLRQDPVLAGYLITNPIVPMPDDMGTTPLEVITPPTRPHAVERGYFDQVRERLTLEPLRECQREAIVALGNYYRRGDINAACVMSVGAGKTAMGVAATLAFARRRALIVTPGRVIRGTFAKALDPSIAGNVLFTLPGGPLISKLRPPVVEVLDRTNGSIRAVSRERLLNAEVIVTNFHSLGESGGEDGLLAKLGPDDVDFIVVDEAHIAVAESYRRLFAHFPNARRLLMSACFSRGDGKPVTADVVYRYRLIDSIADGHAKHLRAHRFSPDVGQTEYEIAWPDGSREQIVGKDALLEVVEDERRVAYVTATSEEPIRKVMEIVRTSLEAQIRVLAPVRPRVLFAAIGKRHAEQISRIANAYGIAAAVLHHSMTDSAIAAVRARFEDEAGTLRAIVQMRMLGQGYDLPAIAIVVPMRPYGGFGEFYQLVGRGIRIVQHAALRDRHQEQHLDLVYRGELGLDDHLEALRVENDMDPHPADADDFGDAPVPDRGGSPTGRPAGGEHPQATVLHEEGDTRQQFLHTLDSIEARVEERRLHAMAQAYARYVKDAPNPQPFERFVAVMRSTHG
ncbi:DEAD/DEAH box helicase family protein [Nonomuraea cavernae]|uniref:DEAD/DEAH box helicase family protein n=1 Tax=Nonomuraea cavernae TaxID=2045107 RepID=UPI0033EC9309